MYINHGSHTLLNVKCDTNDAVLTSVYSYYKHLIYIHVHGHILFAYLMSLTINHT